MGFDTVTLGPAIAPLQIQHWRGIRNALEVNGTEARTLCASGAVIPSPRNRLTTCVGAQSGSDDACARDQFAH